MELRMIFVTIACFWCLMPPALGHSLVALHAAKRAAILGAGAAFKGALVAKGIAAGAAVGAAVKGAALLAAKGAAAKGAAVLAAKGAAVHHTIHHTLHKPVVYEEVVIHKPYVWHPYYVKSVPKVYPTRELVDRLAGLWDVVEGSIRVKSAAVGKMIHALQNNVAHAT